MRFFDTAKLIAALMLIGFAIQLLVLSYVFSFEDAVAALRNDWVNAIRGMAVAVAVPAIVVTLVNRKKRRPR